MVKEIKNKIWEWMEMKDKGIWYNEKICDVRRVYMKLKEQIVWKSSGASVDA